MCKTLYPCRYTHKLLTTPLLSTFLSSCYHPITFSPKPLKIVKSTTFSTKLSTFPQAIPTTNKSKTLYMWRKLHFKSTENIYSYWKFIQNLLYTLLWSPMFHASTKRPFFKNIPDFAYTRCSFCVQGWVSLFLYKTHTKPVNRFSCCSCFCLCTA